MALQDLTPQLRTRMTRVERFVGLFVFLAALLIGAGFTYYLVHTGKSRRWFVNRVPYYCYTRDATGLKPGDPVRLLGRDIGRIVQVETTPPDPWFVDNHYNVFVKFEIWQPYFGYIWTDSRVRVIATDFFGSSVLELTRGTSETGMVTVLETPRFLDSKILSDKEPGEYIPLQGVKSGVWLLTEESTPIAKRAEQVVVLVQEAIPTLTRQISQTLAHTGDAASNANLLLSRLQPTLNHLETLTARLQSEEGAIGRMLLTTNLQAQVETTLVSMDSTLTNTTTLLRTSETQLQDLTRRIALTLDNVALVTSNLAAQVNANSLVLGEVSSLVVNADDMVQGLKRHWLLRPAFSTPPPPALESVVQPTLDPSPR